MPPLIDAVPARPATVMTEIRLVQRRQALRQLMFDGVSSRSLQEALQWVDAHQERLPSYAGWRRHLRRARSWALLATGSALLLDVVIIAVKPWEFSATGQLAFSWSMSGLLRLLVVTAGLALVDAVLTPRPIFGPLRARAHSWWRSWIGKRYIAPFVAPDQYQLLAEREVELLVASGREG